MKRSAFTLMELLVSVVLIALITLFMYGAIASSKTTARTLEKHGSAEQNRTLLYELFYRDIMESLWIEPEQAQKRRFTVVAMQTRNSLYHIAAPHVVYYVNAQTNALVRLESARAISLPVSYEQKNYIFADELVQNVEDFNLYTAGTEANATSVGSLSTGSELLSTQEEEQEENATVQASETTSTQTVRRYLLYLNSKSAPIMLLDLSI